LQHAIERNPNVTKVAFANSPPYWMTNSGCTAGGVNGANNLKSANYSDFANYLTEVLKHFRDNFGTTFDYISPINEPDGGWTASGGQEGCSYSASNQAWIINELKSKLNNNGLSTKIMASEQCIIDNFVSQVGAYDSNTKNAIDTYCTHTYGGTNRTGAYNLAANDNKKLWMSEVSAYPGPHDTTHSEINSSMDLSDRIMSDLKYMKPQAWCAWILSEGEDNCVDLNFNANLIHTPYINNPNHNYYITKQYYTFGQFTRFIRPGYTFIDSNNGNTVSAWDKDSGNLTIVVRNNSGSNVNYEYDLSKFTNVGSYASVYRTSSTENGAQVSNASITNKRLIAAATPNSTTTYVISNMTYNATNGVIVNPSFDDNSTATQTPNGWTTWSNYDSDADYTETNEGGHTGSYHGTHWKASSYEIATGQTVNNLPNGSYNLSAWVKSGGGQNAVYMYCNEYGGNELQANIPTTSTWTKITIPNIQISNGKIQFGIYSLANAGNWIHFDDFVLTQNIKNPSFENDGATQTPNGWTTWSNYDADADYTETNGGGHTGSYHGTHWKASSYEIATGQMVTNLPNGTYTLSAWVKSGGGQNAVYMYCNEYGGNELQANIPTTSTWTQITIPNIQISNGKIQFGIYSRANAGNWIHFDDFVLTPS